MQKTIKYITGSYKNVQEVNISPTLNENSALEKALSYFKAKKYKWENADEEKLVKQIKEDPSATYFPKGELVIVKDFLKTDKEYRLAYKFDIYADMPLSKKIYYIDAINGDLLDIQELIMHGNVNGTADTRYSANQNIVGDSYFGGFRLREVRNGVNIQTYNMNMGTNYGAATDFNDNDNNWTATEHNNANLDNAALDAHWGAEKVYDYFLNTHSRNSYNKIGGALLNYVHYNLVAAGYPNNVNAFWDGSRMTYGDGGSIYGPVVSLDVVAHEIGHGVLQSTSAGGLRYSGESGAINEGLSDIWAACVEAQAAPSKQKWEIGEDISAFGIGLRSMSNPNSRGQPDTYMGTNWLNTNCGTPNFGNDYCGVHTNSGVLNYWFYLLTEGGTGINDINNSFSVTGIGITDAEKIAYRTLNNFLESHYDVTFAMVRGFSIQAAIDLFGSGSCQVMNTTKAWYAVGVGADYDASNIFAIQGPYQFCDSAIYSIPNLPSGTSISWSIEGYGAEIVSSSGNQVTVVGDYYGEFRVKANVTSTCGTFVTKSNLIVFGFPYTVGITQVSNDGMGTSWGELCSNSPNYDNYYNTLSYTVQSNISTPASYPLTLNYVFYDENGDPHGATSTSISSGTGSVNLPNLSPGFYSLQVWLSGGPCNTSSEWTEEWIEYTSCGNFTRLITYPNPSNETLIISYKGDESFAKTNSLKNTASEEKHLLLFDDKGKEVKKDMMKAGDTKLEWDIKNLPSGRYFLHIKEGKEVVKKQIIIKH